MVLAGFAILSLLFAGLALFVYGLVLLMREHLKTQEDLGERVEGYSGRSADLAFRLDNIETVLAHAATAPDLPAEPPRPGP